MLEKSNEKPSLGLHVKLFLMRQPWDINTLLLTKPAEEPILSHNTAHSSALKMYGWVLFYVFVRYSNPSASAYLG
jgi:hypothetical protein